LRCIATTATAATDNATDTVTAATDGPAAAVATATPVTAIGTPATVVDTSNGGGRGRGAISQQQPGGYGAGGEGADIAGQRDRLAGRQEKHLERHDLQRPHLEREHLEEQILER